MRKNIFFVLPIFLFVLLVAVSGVAMMKGKAPPQGRLAGVPAFSIAGLSDGDLRHGVAVVNFFASWCAPCEAEHPFITDLAGKTAVYGINFLDSTDKRDRYLKKLGNPYKKLGDDAEGTAAAAWGVEGMPTTFVIRDGKIIYRFDGSLTEELVKTEILPLLGSRK